MAQVQTVIRSFSKWSRRAQRWMLPGSARVALLICAAWTTTDALQFAAPLLRARPHHFGMSDSCEDGACGIPGGKGVASARNLGLRGGEDDAVVNDVFSDPA